MENKNDPWENDESCWEKPEYLQWLKKIWHVEIAEQPRHVWAGQWTVNGYWQDEKDLYRKYEKEWENRCQEVWNKKYPNGREPELDDCFHSGRSYGSFGDNVETPGWSMHRNGCWQKMLIDINDWKSKTRDQYPGIFNSYEHACKTLANYCDFLPPRFTDYEKHLKDCVDKYKYDQ